MRTATRGGPGLRPGARTHWAANTPISWRLDARGIGQRAQQIEDRAGAQLDARAGDVTHGTMVAGRHHEADAGLPDRLLHQRELGVDIDAELGQHLGRAGTWTTGHDCHAWRPGPRRRRPRSRPRSRYCGCRFRRRPCRRCRSRLRGAAMRAIRSRRLRAPAVISSTVSPRTRSAISNPATCAGVALPVIIRPNASPASASLKGAPEAALAISSLKRCRSAVMRARRPGRGRGNCAGSRGRARSRCSRDETARREWAGTCDAGP